MADLVGTERGEELASYANPDGLAQLIERV
jgi:hypothetical protein